MLQVEEFDGCWIFRESPTSRQDDLDFDEALDAWHSGQDQLAESLFSKLLAKNPFHIDAMHGSAGCCQHRIAGLATDIPMGHSTNGMGLLEQQAFHACLPSPWAVLLG